MSSSSEHFSASSQAAKELTRSSAKVSMLELPDSALAAIRQVQAPARAKMETASTREDALSAALQEILDLCALGDVDEHTEELGWGEVIKSAKALLATPKD